MMTRDEALELLRGGPEGVEEWNRRPYCYDVVSPPAARRSASAPRPFEPRSC